MRSKQQGGSLITTVVAIGIFGIIVLMVLKTAGVTSRATATLKVRGDLQSVKQLLQENIDCQTTFAVAGLAPFNPAHCPSTTAAQSGPYLIPYRAVDGGPSVPMTTDPDDDSGKLGPYRLRVSCSADEATLVVRIAKKRGSTFVLDPMTKKPFDWNSRRSLLFGGSGEGIPLCYHTPVSHQKTYQADTNRLYSRGVDYTMQDPCAAQPAFACSTKTSIELSRSLPTIQAAKDIDVVLRYEGGGDWNGGPDTSMRQLIMEFHYTVGGSSHTFIGGWEFGEGGTALSLVTTIPVDAGDTLVFDDFKFWLKQFRPGSGGPPITSPANMRLKGSISATILDRY